jgi:uncharacterized protein YjbI with pentapeptide repeats
VPPLIGKALGGIPAMVFSQSTESDLMALNEYLSILNQGVAAWNAWRENNDIFPDLSGADLCGFNLEEANLDGADLSRARLSGANLRRAILNGADLGEADLCEADLRGTYLYTADLGWAMPWTGGDRGANLTRAKLKRLIYAEPTLDTPI